MSQTSEERLGDFINSIKETLDNVKQEFPDVKIILTAFHVQSGGSGPAPYVLYSDLPSDIAAACYCGVAKAIEAKNGSLGEELPMVDIVEEDA